MANTALVTERDNLVGTIEFDAVVREQHTLSAQATEHAIEGSGQPRTDHVHQRPDVLVLECVASNTPLRAPDTQSNGTRAVQAHVDVDYSVGLLPASPVTPALGPLDRILQRTITERVTTVGFEPGFNRRQDVWKELRRLKENGELITVVTSLEEYTNMVIEEIAAEATASNGNSLECTITLKKVALSQSKLVAAPEIPKPAVPRGRQNANAVEDEERTSALFKAAVAAGAAP